MDPDSEPDEEFEMLLEKQAGATALAEDSDMEDDDGDDVDSNVDSENNDLSAMEEEGYDEEKLTKTEQRLRQHASIRGNHRDVDEGMTMFEEKISNIAASMGGIDPITGEYILGTEVYGCLNDLKKLWRFDEETGSLNMAYYSYKTGIFINDLIPIFTQYYQDERNSRVALISLEMMSKLTNPIIIPDSDADDENQEMNLIHNMDIKFAQVAYKNQLLNYQNGQILENVLSMCMPLLKKSKNDRTHRENVILSISMNLFVNILRIEPSMTFKSFGSRTTKSAQLIETIPTGVNKSDISFDHTLRIFERFKVFQLFQTISALLTSEFDTTILGTRCMDFYYYLYAGVRPETLVNKKPTSSRQSDEDQENNVQEVVSSDAKELSNLLTTETKKKKAIFAQQSSRHAHFGTLLKIKDGTNRYRTVMGQSKLMNDSILDLMDNKESKKLGSNQYRENKTTKDDRLMEKTTPVNSQSITLLTEFTNEFLDNCFGNMMNEYDNKVLRHVNSKDFVSIADEYHYLFLINWVLRYQRLSRTRGRRTISDMLSFKRINYALLPIVIERLIQKYLKDVGAAKTTLNYPMIRMAMRCIQEIILCCIHLHSYSSFLSDSPGQQQKLLKEDEIAIKAYVKLATDTMGCMFKSGDRIKLICSLPRDAHKISIKHAEMSVEFINSLLKFFKYVKSLKEPLLIIQNKYYQFDEEEQEEENGFIENRKSDKPGQYLPLDMVSVAKFTAMLLHENLVDLHVWFFTRWEMFKEDKMTYVLKYFSLLVDEKWESNFIKLVRLDFMLALYGLKDSPFSSLTLTSFGQLLDRFMHLLAKLHSNTKCILLEPMTLSPNTNSQIVDYYLTGDPFVDSRQQAWDDNFDNTTKYKDVSFVDESIGQSQKIALVVTRLVYDDNERMVQLLIKILNQWYKELNSEEISLEERMVRVGGFKLQAESFKFSKQYPYFRLLCSLVDIQRGILTNKLLEKVKENLELVSAAIETPLDEFDLDGRFIDENIGGARQSAEGEEYRGGYYGAGIVNDNYNSEDDLAGPEDEENDPLALMEAQLSSLDRTKGQAVKKSKPKPKQKRSKVNGEDGSRKKKKRKTKSTPELSEMEAVHDDNDNDDDKEEEEEEEEDDDEDVHEIAANPKVIRKRAVILSDDEEEEDGEAGEEEEEEEEEEDEEPKSNSNTHGSASTLTSAPDFAATLLNLRANLSKDS